MKKIKIYTYNIDQIDIKDDIKDLKEYFMSPFVKKFIPKGIELDVVVEKTNIKKEDSLSLFEKSSDEITVYLTDNVYSNYFGWTFKIQNRIGIYLKCDKLHDDIDYTWKSLAHEIMHGLRMLKEMELGRPLPDPMDLFYRNGKEMRYYKNDDPYAEDGNFSEALRILGIFEDIEVHLKRDSKNSSKQTLGKLAIGSFKCNTLELPYLNNMPNISCIPKGKYQVKWTFSPRFMKYTYEVIGVPNRSGIRIHVANYYYQLNGCIALGLGLNDIDKDGIIDVTESKKAIKEFEDLMGRKEFTLIIS